MEEQPKRLWWVPELKEVGAFLIGSFILIYETVYSSHVDTILVLAGVAMMGVLGSGIAQRALRKLLEE